MMLPLLDLFSLRHEPSHLGGNLLYQIRRPLIISAELLQNDCRKSFLRCIDVLIYIIHIFDIDG